MEFVKSRLLEFNTNETVVNKATSSFFARKDIKCFKCGKSGHVKSVCGIKCHNCNRLGHKASQCRVTKERQANYAGKDEQHIKKISPRNKSEWDQEPIAFCATSLGTPSTRMEWYADSGATHHYINDEEVMYNKRRFPEPKIIHLAEEGKTMEATCIGDVRVLSKVGEKFLPIVLKDVLCVPKLRVNLISISTIEKAGFKVICFNSSIRVKRNKILYLEGKRSGNLYKVHLYQHYNQSKSANVAINQDEEIWHKRFGHVNYQTLLNMNKLNLVYGMNFNSKSTHELCEVCVLTKQKCLPFHSRKSRSSRVLELVHTDICGPLTPESNSKNRYIITFIDDFSRFSVVYVIKNKNEALNCLKNYKAKVETLHGNKLTKIKCDNGGEYCSNSWKDFCSEAGIQILYTPPYSPQVNGVAERINQTLLNKARSMILQAKMEKSFWEEAVLTATYILNRTQSCLDKNKTPYELWLEKRPNVMNMRIFGCICYSRVPDALRSKLDNKGKKCRLVGYTENGYRLWDLENKKLIHSRNVIFNEMNFDETEIFQNNVTEEDPNVKYDSEDEIESSEDNRSKTSEKYVCIDENEVETQRPKRNIKLPPKYDDFDMNVSCLALLTELSHSPNSYSEATASSEWNFWEKAIKDELEALQENDTWELVNKPANKKIISNRWVFRTKSNNNGETIYKARLVARGFEQNIDDLSLLHAPVAKLSTFRILLSVTIKYNSKLEQLDVKNAFLNGSLSEEVYMTIPEGIEINESNKSKVCLLKRSIYGLKQAPKVWNQRFNEFMIKSSFNRSKSDYCLYVYVKNNVRCYLLLYVDDILLACNDINFLKVFKSNLCGTFKMKTFGELFSFLGINVVFRTEENLISIDQISAIQTLIKKYNVENCKNFKTPIEKDLNLERNTCETLKTKLPYKELLGSLMYIMIGSRPDICYSVGYFSRFQDCATDKHFTHLLRVLKYLKTTINLKLLFSKNGNDLTGYSDADWANDKNDRKSISGYCFVLFGNLISWSSKKQSMVALSTTESEFIAICNAISELLHVHNVLNDLDIHCTIPYTMYEDNQSTIKLLSNFENNRRCKHIDIKFHFVLDIISKGLVKIEYVCSNEQLGDIFTKPLSTIKFHYFVKMLNLEV